MILLQLVVAMKVVAMIDIGVWAGKHVVDHWNGIIMKERSLGGSRSNNYNL